jgi:hypothetical protein
MPSIGRHNIPTTQAIPVPESESCNSNIFLEFPAGTTAGEHLRCPRAGNSQQQGAHHVGVKNGFRTVAGLGIGTGSV